MSDAPQQSQLETELATAQRLLTEERQHTEDLKGHQAEEVRQIRTEVERLKGTAARYERSFIETCEVRDSLRAQLQAKEQEFIRVAEEATRANSLYNAECRDKRAIMDLLHKTQDEAEGATILKGAACATLRQQLAARDATIARLRDALLKIAEGAGLPITDEHPRALIRCEIESVARDALAQVPPSKPDSQTAPKDHALTLTTFCGLPADALEKHLKVCPPDCDPAIWQPDANQATGEAQPKDAQ